MGMVVLRGGGWRPVVYVEIPWVALKENVPLFGGHLEEDLLLLQGQKTKQPFIGKGQRCTQRADNLVTAFCYASP